MSNPFTKAARDSAKLKLAITGPSGSGKTTAALRCARGLVGPLGKIAVIDTENRSASLYSDLTDFYVLNIEPPFEHSQFADAIKAAEANGYDAVIIDSASHLWEAILAYKDKLDRRGGNSYTNWNEAGGKFREVVDCLLAANLHVISCLRSKMEHALEKDDKGRTTIRKVGMAPIMRDGIEYEFTLVLDLDMGHQAVSSKDRTRLFDGRIVEITEETGKALGQWLSGAKVEPAKPAAKEEAKPKAKHDPDEGKKILAKVNEAWKALGKDDGDVGKACKFAGDEKANCFDGLNVSSLRKLLTELERQMQIKTEAKAEAAKPAPEPEDDIPMVHANDLAKRLPEGSEDAVNGYLVKLHWIKQGQTFRDLEAGQVEKILGKLDSFLSKAGITKQAA
jgi:energy-coupling factor transporter ATP-binding protein EcfA2